ncbi:MAG: hypothetical protein AAF399_08480 [Bacteroidota bacterium]
MIDQIIGTYLSNLKKITASVGPPVRFSDQTLQSMLSDILKGALPEYPINERTFYLALNIKEARFLAFDEKGTTMPGVKQALGFEETLDFESFLQRFIPREMLVDYLFLGSGAYEIACEPANQVHIQQHMFQEDLYLLNAKGEKFLVLQTIGSPIKETAT